MNVKFNPELCTKYAANSVNSVNSVKHEDLKLVNSLFVSDILNLYDVIVF